MIRMVVLSILKPSSIAGHTIPQESRSRHTHCGLVMVLAEQAIPMATSATCGALLFPTQPRSLSA
jgi:hypothetical protein